MHETGDPPANNHTMPNADYHDPEIADAFLGETPDLPWGSAVELIRWTEDQTTVQAIENAIYAFSTHLVEEDHNWYEALQGQYVPSNAAVAMGVMCDHLPLMNPRLAFVMTCVGARALSLFEGEVTANREWARSELPATILEGLKRSFGPGDRTSWLREEVSPGTTAAGCLIGLDSWRRDLYDRTPGDRGTFLPTDLQDELRQWILWATRPAAREPARDAGESLLYMLRDEFGITLPAEVCDQLYQQIRSSSLSGHFAYLFGGSDMRKETWQKILDRRELNHDEVFFVRRDVTFNSLPDGIEYILEHSQPGVRSDSVMRTAAEAGTLKTLWQKAQHRPAWRDTVMRNMGDMPTADLVDFTPEDVVPWLSSDEPELRQLGLQLLARVGGSTRTDEKSG